MGCRSFSTGWGKTFFQPAEPRKCPFNWGYDWSDNSAHCTVIGGNCRGKETRVTETDVGNMMNVVYNMDAVEFMKSCDDNQFDLLVADPPYFSGPEKRGYYGKKVSTTGIQRVDYPITDKWEVPDKEYFQEAFRVSRNQIIWGCNHFDWPFTPGRIVWDKVNGESTYSDCEIAYCSMHDSVRLFRYMWNGAMQGKSMTEGHIMQGNKELNELRIHPTQKPVILYDWIFKNYAKPGWKVLDTHVGSGSIRISADKYGASLIGTELNPIHYERQYFRFKEYKRQTSLEFTRA